MKRKADPIDEMVLLDEGGNLIPLLETNTCFLKVEDCECLSHQEICIESIRDAKIKKIVNNIFLRQSYEYHGFRPIC